MNIKDCRGELHPPMRFNDVSNLTTDNIASIITDGAADRNVPVNVTKTSIHSGGLFFGSDYPCVMVSHPNPPQEYFSLLFIINGNTLSFMLWGNSKANYNRNKKAEYKQEGKLFRSMFVSDDPMALQTEQAWEADVMNILESTFIP